MHAGHPVQRSVYKAGLRALEEALGHLDIFVDGNFGGHIGAAFQLERPCPQNGPHGGVQSFQPPALGQPLHNGGVDRGLPRHDAAHQVCKEPLVSRRQGFAVDIAIKPVLAELADHVFDADGRDFHLIERLHVGQACDGA